MEDGQGKQFEKQTPTVFDRRTWLWNTTEAKLSILPVEFKLSKHISLSINRACVKQQLDKHTTAIFYCILRTQLERTTAIQLQLQHRLADC